MQYAVRYVGIRSGPVEVAHLVYSNFSELCFLPTVDPQLNTFANERDVCDFYFTADHCMHKAFFQDLRSDGDSATTIRNGDGQHPKDIEGQSELFQGQGELGRMQGIRHGDGGILGIPPRFRDNCIEGVKPRRLQCRLSIGAALKVFLKTVSPDFTRLVAGMEK